MRLSGAPGVNVPISGALVSIAPSSRMKRGHTNCTAFQAVHLAASQIIGVGAPPFSNTAVLYGGCRHVGVYVMTGGESQYRAPVRSNVGYPIGHSTTGCYHWSDLGISACYQPKVLVTI